jgi:hypothetical protein
MTRGVVVGFKPITNQRSVSGLSVARKPIINRRSVTEYLA